MRESRKEFEAEKVLVSKSRDLHSLILSLTLFATKSKASPLSGIMSAFVDWGKSNFYLLDML